MSKKSASDNLAGNDAQKNVKSKSERISEKAVTTYHTWQHDVWHYLLHALTISRSPPVNSSSITSFAPYLKGNGILTNNQHGTTQQKSYKAEQYITNWVKL